MTDVFRKEYKELTNGVKDDILMIKIYAEKLLHEIEKSALISTCDPRMIALAKTNLEQAVMWAVKSIT